MMWNLLLSRSNIAATEPTSEMPDDSSFPLGSLDEVDCFEDWLKNPANAIKKQQMVFIMLHVRVYSDLWLVCFVPIQGLN